jgi:hypothetical protein
MANQKFQFEITRYRLEKDQRGDPKIVIEQIKAMDDNGKYIKFCKLAKVLPFLSEHPVRFKAKNG